MDQRGHYLPHSNQYPHRNRDKESAQQRWDYPPPDPRKGSRHRGHSHSRYLAPFTPAGSEQFPYNFQHYSYSYGWQEHQRPQSRHGYDCPPHSSHDYRDSYYDYYRGQHAHDGEQWGPQYSWQTARYQEGAHQQEGVQTQHIAYRYEDGTNGSQQYFSNHDESPSLDNEGSCYYPGTLESSKTSGLSSSSYELSQYMNGADLCNSDPLSASTADREHKAVHQVTAPLKFSSPHAVVSFGPAGQLLRVTPCLSAQESVSQLQIHSMEVILCETQEQQEMRDFPGPLTREDLHKVDAIDFAQHKAGACMRDVKLPDRSSAALLWNLLILLCRQNGQIVGSDIAELLVQDFHLNGNCESETPTLIDFSETAAIMTPATGGEGDDLLTGDLSSFCSENPQKALQSYTQLLLGGRKKVQFTSQLAASDPLQTLFQLLSGRIPTVTTCCVNKKWGDWRPHLAVMLSNETGNPAMQQKAIITMGDSLASRGLIHAAHVCYLTAGAPFGVFTQKAERLVLLGSSHRQSFGCFATNAAIQCTELYEYSQTLGGKCFSVPSLQVYKFLYACRLLDSGLWSQAFHYCEVVGRAILRQREPDFGLTAEVIKLSDRLRYSEGQYSETGSGGALQEPEWLKNLRSRHQSLQTGSYDCTETHSPLQSSACEDSDGCLESDQEDLSCHVQPPEPELLYFRASEDQENLIDQNTGDMAAMICSDRGEQDWKHTDSPFIPAPVVYAPQGPTVATNQSFSSHITDSVEIQSSSPHCSPSDWSPAVEEELSSSGPQMMLEVDLSQQVVPPAAEAPSETPKESPKTGWFREWFKSKPKQEAAQTGPSPPAGLCPPPPPAVPPPGTFPSPPSAGINPFSRTAGQQLRK